MPRFAIIYLFYFVLVLNCIVKAQDSVLSKPNVEKRFFHDLHLGIKQMHFQYTGWDSYWWKTFLPNYTVKFKEKNFSAAFYAGIYFSHYNDFGIDNATFWNTLEWSLETGYKERYFLKLRRVVNMHANYVSAPFGNYVGYVDGRHYSINDYILHYAPSFAYRADKFLKLGGGLTFCKGHESYIKSITMHSGGWYEAFGDAYNINDRGYILDAEYYIRPWKHISFKAFADYRVFKDIPSLFSYGISGGLSF